MKKILKNFEHLIELLPDIAYFKDLEGHYLYANDHFLKFHRKERKFVINKTAHTLFSKERADQIEHDDQVILKNKQPISFEESFINDNEKIEYFLTTHDIIYNDDGKPLGIFSISKDITSIKHYEIIDEDSKNLLEFIATHHDLQAALNEIALLCESRVSHSKCSILLLSADKKYLLEGAAPSLPDFYNQAIYGVEIGANVGSCGSAIFFGKRVIIENINSHENWKPFLALTQKANLHACWSEPIFSSKDEILGSFAIYHSEPKRPSVFELKLITAYAHLASVAIEKDINTRLIFEKDNQITHQSRLALMGEMISMIAHQWRQPLAAIAAVTTGIIIKLSLKDETKHSKEEHYIVNKAHLIEEYIQTLTQTINDFRTFYKKDKDFGTMHVEVPLKKALNIIKSTFSNQNITLEEQYQSTQSVPLLESEIMQVILNIIQNAQDVLIMKQISKPKIKISTYDQKDQVVIEIDDNAGGIINEYLTKIFEPYFSTKSAKNGTGLGLYMSKIIIDDHHKGRLSVHNTKRGACFRIELPVRHPTGQSMAHEI